MLNMGIQEVGFQCEVHDQNHEFTPTEIQELLSLFVTNDVPPSPDSDSQGSNRTIIPTFSTIDHERKLRRMISNRESARRSRWRKKKHLEDLTNEVNRLMSENQDLKNRLGQVLNHCDMVMRENDFLWIEFVGLRARLSDLCRILVQMHSSSKKFT